MERPTFDDIVQATARATGIPRKRLFDKIHALEWPKPKPALALVAYDITGMQYVQMASLMGVSRSTIRPMIQRAIEMCDRYPEFADLCECIAELAWEIAAKRHARERVLNDLMAEDARRIEGEHEQ